MPLDSLVDPLGWSREVLAHAVLEDDGLVLIGHSVVHHRAVPVALHVLLAVITGTRPPR